MRQTSLLIRLKWKLYLTLNVWMEYDAIVKTKPAEVCGAMWCIFLEKLIKKQKTQHNLQKFIYI